MILAEATGHITELFPTRFPEPTEAMTLEESRSFAAWQESPEGMSFYLAQAAHIVSRLGLSQGRVVSVGEGGGLLAAELARLLPACQVLGIDLCPEVVERASSRPNLPPNVEYRVMAAQDLAKNEAGLDAVVSFSSFHHFEAPRHVIAALVASLRPGGSLLIVDLRRDSNPGAYFRRIDDHVREENWTKARLFRASVAGSHTLAELRDLLLPHAQRPDSLSVAPLNPSPELCAVTRANVRGLFVEAHLETAV